MYKTPLERTLFYNIKIILKNESNLKDIYRNICTLLFSKFSRNIIYIYIFL